MTARRGRVVLLRPIARPTVRPAPAVPPSPGPRRQLSIDRLRRSTSPVGLPRPDPPSIAAVAAAAVLATSAGDGFVAVLALAVAGGVATGVVAGLAVAAAVARWGTADLGAIAGDQAVLGIAVGTGGATELASSALAAVALLLVARRRPGPWPFALPVALGFGAAALAAGPATGRPGGLAVRLGASGLAVLAALALARAVLGRHALDRALRTAGLLAAVAAFSLAAS